jgi:hypothetical protein
VKIFSCGRALDHVECRIWILGDARGRSSSERATCADMAGDAVAVEDTIPDKNLFMMCDRLNPRALRPLPDGYHVRYCRRDELAIWKAMPFADEQF